MFNNNKWLCKPFVYIDHSTGLPTNQPVLNGPVWTYEYTPKYTSIHRKINTIRWLVTHQPFHTHSTSHNTIGLTHTIDDLFMCWGVVKHSFIHSTSQSRVGFLFVVIVFLMHILLSFSILLHLSIYCAAIYKHFVACDIKMLPVSVYFLNLSFSLSLSLSLSLVLSPTYSLILHFLFLSHPH